MKTTEPYQIKIGLMIILGMCILIAGILIDKSISQNGKLKEQHLRYQIGIDSLIYDRELMFYHRRHE